MKAKLWLEDSRRRLDIVAGLVDGLLNALVLATGRILKSHGFDFGLILRVGAATGLTTLFVFFMAHYAEQRAELVRAERQLNLTSHGRLAASRLGRGAVAAAAAGAFLAACCGVVGAAGALLISMCSPGPPGVGIAATIALLGGLGAVLARSFHGSIVFWSIVMMAGGVALTVIGAKIDLAG